MVFRSIKSFKKTVKKMRERFPEFNELGFTDEECFAFGCLIKCQSPFPKGKGLNREV